MSSIISISFPGPTSPISRPEKACQLLMEQYGKRPSSRSGAWCRCVPTQSCHSTVITERKRRLQGMSTEYPFLTPNASKLTSVVYNALKTAKGALVEDFQCEGNEHDD